MLASGSGERLEWALPWSPWRPPLSTLLPPPNSPAWPHPTCSRPHSALEVLAYQLFLSFFLPISDFNFRLDPQCRRSLLRQSATSPLPQELQMCNHNESTCSLSDPMLDCLGCVCRDCWYIRQMDPPPHITPPSMHFRGASICLCTGDPFADAAARPQGSDEPVGIHQKGERQIISHGLSRLVSFAGFGSDLWILGWH